MKKVLVLTVLALLLSGCGVNLVMRAGVDIDPSLERLVSDIREIANEYKAEEK